MVYGIVMYGKIWCGMVGQTGRPAGKMNSVPVIVLTLYLYIFYSSLGILRCRPALASSVF